MKLRALLKLTVVFLFLFALGHAVRAQDAPPGFDVADFNKKFEVVQWLVAYDAVAWKTTDLMLAGDKAELAKLGKEWFCFQDKSGLWHAVYGKLQEKTFDQVFHFVLDANGKITRSADQLNQAFLIAHARALQLAVARMTETIPATSPRHNSYIRQNPDKTFTVWLLPAFQPNDVAVYGGEFIYTIDSASEKITRDDSYFQGQFHGFNVKPAREIWLNYREKEKPTLGAIFFVWYYREYFTKIFIDNAKTTSTVINAGNNNYIWAHVVKDKKNGGAD